MRITGKGTSKGIAATPRTGAPAGTSAQTAGGSRASDTVLQSSVLAPALDSLAAQPEIDQAKVEQLRGALARGEISFNPTRLAALIQRYHGNHD